MIGNVNCDNIEILKYKGSISMIYIIHLLLINEDSFSVGILIDGSNYNWESKQIDVNNPEWVWRAANQNVIAKREKNRLY